MSQVDSKYTLVHLAARRAREINEYYHSLGEGLGQYTPPLVDQVDSNKPLSIALEEIAAQKIVVRTVADARRAAEQLLGADAEGEGEDAAILSLGAEGDEVPSDEIPPEAVAADDTPLGEGAIDIPEADEAPLDGGAIDADEAPLGEGAIDTGEAGVDPEAAGVVEGEPPPEPDASDVTS